MHTVCFSIKRADQACLARLRAWLEPFEITPARYDLLFVIQQSGVDVGTTRWMYQSNIWRALGVTPATVCKMLRALEQDGLVKRERSIIRDTRQVRVELTRKARGLLRRVHQKVIRPGIIYFTLYTALYLGGEVGTLKFLLDDLRAKLGDRARFHFPWCRRTLYPRRTAQHAAAGGLNSDKVANVSARFSQSHKLTRH